MSVQRAALMALVLPASIAAAQNNLGEVLDAGGKRVYAEEFKRDVVGRPVIGAAATGFTFEMIYTQGGEIRGVASNDMMSGRGAPNVLHGISGSWRSDNGDRICASMVVQTTVLPTRCQYWYRIDERYFISDSDSDRSMRVLRRTLKP